MRLLYLIDSLSPGGAERSLLAITHHLISKGIDLEVAYLVEKRRNLRTGFRDAGARVIAVGGSSRLEWLIQATRLIRSHRPNLVHTTLFEADLVGRLAGLLGGSPVVSSLVSLPYGPEQLGDRRLSRWKVEGARVMDAATARIPVRFHAVSNEVGEVMGRRLRVPRDRIDVVPRGRDPAALGTRTPERRLQARHALGISTNHPVILAVGRQEYPKGFDILLTAFRRILDEQPRARLYLCGRRGMVSPDLEKQANAIGQQVTILGHRDDVPDLICAADVVVLPSRWEGIGGVLLEAMALEAPVVASNLPALRDVLANGRCGRLVTPERPDELSQAILRTLRDGEETVAAVRAGRLRFNQVYRADRVADQMVAFYDRALSQSTTRRGISSSERRRPDRSMRPLPKTVVQRMDRFLVHSPVQGAFHRRSERRLAVLAYHRIEDFGAFSKQLDYLGREAYPVSLEEALAAIAGNRALPKHAVLITFDDADRSLVDHGLGTLRERGLPGVAFVIAGHLNGHQPFWWTEVEGLVRSGGSVPEFVGLSGGEVVRRLKLVSEDQRRVAIDALRKSSPGVKLVQAQLGTDDLHSLETGGVVIGNHTVTHPCLPNCTGDQVRQEIGEAHAILEEAMGKAPEVFAFPNGDWDARAEPILEELGYRAGFLFNHAIVKPPARHRYRISRVRVDSTTSIERLGLILSGLHPAIHRVRTRMMIGQTSHG
jgi:glycosyltransferase involved in cell wall biosynthesis/peptidoglycan/xylan/chitin deacetylase (PgdA/CDA1 family)